MLRLADDRASERDLRNWLPLLSLAALAWLLEICDAATAVIMMQSRGDTAELNPVVRGVFMGLGPLAVVLLKFGLATVVLGAFLYLARGRRRVLARNSLLMATALAAVGVMSNLG